MLNRPKEHSFTFNYRFTSGNSKSSKMSISIPIKTLFLDIGGVMLTNGWGHESRLLAAQTFNLDHDEMEERHQLNVVTFEEGKMSLNEYLNRVVFYRHCAFTRKRFQQFMFAQSAPHTEMFELIRKLKEKQPLKIIVVNNEGRELNEYRIKKFKLDQFVDCFISSCFVHFRKPDTDIFLLALDIAQAQAKQVTYIEDTKMFVDVASELGIRSIHHTNVLSTSKELASLGLKIEKK
jgi:putative hydrolase of the HAD superfamily